MSNRRDDFPIFRAHPDLVYLDNSATVHKPASVIDAVSDYLGTYNANIHRGGYELADISEELYARSKKSVAHLIGGRPSEIVYTYNATYGMNILAQTLYVSGVLQSGDVVLVNIAEHHANIVPWQTLARDHGINVIFFDENTSIDTGNNFVMCYEKYKDRVRVVASTMVSNVTGAIYDLASMRTIVGSDVLIAADLSQAIPHCHVDVKALGIDMAVRTGHKMMGMTGIGCIWAKKQYRQHRIPSMSGGGAIRNVCISGFEPLSGAAAWEIGTPNVVGAVSLLAACDYIDSVGGMDAIGMHEEGLVDYTCAKRRNRAEHRRVLGDDDRHDRIGIWTFVPVSQTVSGQLIGEMLARKNIAVRAGGHCAHPLLHTFGETSAVRMSTYLYNTTNDIDRFFDELDAIYCI